MQKIDITLISETHFTSRTTIKIPCMCQTQPNNAAYGGAAVIILNSISHCEIIHKQSDNVKVDTKLGPPTVSAIYCPPN